MLAQVILAGDISQLVISIIVIAAVIGIGLIVVRQSGIAIPPWIVQIFWIVLLACVAIYAIRFLLGAV